MVFENAVTLSVNSILILNYVKEMCTLQCAIKMSDCDYSYYYLNKCSRFKKRLVITELVCFSRREVHDSFKEEYDISSPSLAIL